MTVTVGIAAFGRAFQATWRHRGAPLARAVLRQDWRRTSSIARRVKRAMVPATARPKVVAGRIKWAGVVAPAVDATAPKKQKQRKGKKIVGHAERGHGEGHDHPVPNGAPEESGEVPGPIPATTLITKVVPPSGTVLGKRSTARSHPSRAAIAMRPGAIPAPALRRAV